MANQQVSPISQMLHTLGITREDLSRRSDEMRQFLTSQGSPTLRVAGRGRARRDSSSSDLRPPSQCVDSRSSFARSASRSCSASLREPSPPTTPVKTEPSENTVSLRHYDTMDVVIERQRRQSRREKRTRRDKERDLTIRSNLPHQTSPSPSSASHASLNLDSFMHSRDNRRVSSTDLQDNHTNQLADEPITPQRRQYYREHTHLSSGETLPKEGELHPKAETITASTLHHDAMPQNRHFHGYQASHNPFASDGSTEASTSRNPVTPQRQRGPMFSCGPSIHDFPSSSPLPSSPLSSPSRPAINLVSSPGPMGPLPKEDEYDRLPYRLPPGPYSPKKPDLSYAALVGQAILSSLEHRLTLQEIYDWITIVYPHYKRGETTWMNSIRHVLSTTVCFRKVPRDRSVGRTQWAIWDEDMECFKGGGFRKHLCKDIMRANQLIAKGKGRARKRSEGEDDSTPDNRKNKRTRRTVTCEPSQASTSQTSYNAPPPLSHPLFPPSRPTPHHQPYYESCIMQPQPRSLPAEIIFPPLPPTAYSRFHNVINDSSTQTPARTSSKESPCFTHNGLPLDLPAPSSDASSMLSVPELTPNRSSSSPPPSLPLTSGVDLDGYINMDHSQKERETGDHERQRISASDGTSETDTSTSFDGETDEILFRTTTLVPVQYWGETPKRGKPKRSNTMDSRNRDGPLKNNKNMMTGVEKRAIPKLLPSLPTSPTLEVKAVRAMSSSMPATPVNDTPRTPPQSQIPQSLPLPMTPPRATSLEISSVRTPLSHKGLHMSPSTSLAHYKSNLDPPPPAQSYLLDAEESQANVEVEDANESIHTPRRPTAVLAPPVTPKRLYSGATDVRTPLGGVGTSPFRTPSSRSVFDPHDPGALLDEELNRAAAGQDDSPIGLFGKGHATLLYDSPGALSSPGKWFKWW
ncbi:hypothetical protein AX15_002169 [Amanita polypyramis BW_CC]|nr:hypothetical protein AX15_002169 [Amanita polypyramis BW_CC]